MENRNLKLRPDTTKWTKIYTMVVVFCCNSFPYVLFIQYYSETRNYLKSETTKNCWNNLNFSILIIFKFYYKYL
uniref:Uncharacterized protein n=1 Tax=Meloidogyne enterolobii TaxID=390850 RepID=A0A6V7VRG7_MELEN|nr:unnamed protein product [Meloidogyne enterolobii]